MKRTEVILVNGESIAVEIQEQTGSMVTFVVNGRTYRVGFEQSVPLGEGTTELNRNRPAISRSSRPRSAKSVVAPISGVVVSIDCKAGDSVESGAVLLRVEAMKMQNNIVAERSGTIAEVVVSIGDEVREGQELVVFG